MTSGSVTLKGGDTVSKYYYRKYETVQIYSDSSTTYTYNGTSTESKTEYHKAYSLDTTYTLSDLTTDVVESILKSNVAVDSTAGLYCSSGLTEITDTSTTLTRYAGIITLSTDELWTVTAYKTAAFVVAAHSGRTMMQLKNNAYAYNVGTLTTVLADSAGTYIGEVIAEDGTYPDKGKGDDGYWYVKDRLAVEFKARIDGAWVTTEPYVRVGGVWVKADVHPRVDGVWVG